MKGKIGICFMLWIILLMSFSVASEDFYGSYQGNLVIESFNETLVKQLSEDSGQSVEDLKQEISNSLSDNYMMQITSSDEMDLIVLESGGEFKTTIQGSKINFKIILAEGVYIALMGERYSNGDISGELTIETPIGSLASGSFSMNKSNSIGEISKEETPDEPDENEVSEEEREENVEEDLKSQEENDDLELPNEITTYEIPNYEPLSDNFLPISSLEEEFRDEKEVSVKNTEDYLVKIYNKNSNVEIEEDLAGRLKIYKNDPNDDLSYAKKKYVMKGTNIILEKIVENTPMKYFVESANNLIKNETYDREDKIRETKEDLNMNSLEARGYNDFSNFEEKEKFLTPIKKIVTDQDGPVGLTLGLVQKQLDKLAKSKKKALGKAVAREYRNFAKTYIKTRKDKSHEDAIKAAVQSVEDQNYNAEKEGGAETAITFRSNESSFFKEPIKFLSYKLLNRESKVKTIESRAGIYIGYLKEDDIYVK